MQTETEIHSMALPRGAAEPRLAGTQAHLAHEIGVDCQRALTRLDRLQRERHDVVLDHARALIGRAAALSRVLERTC